MEAALAVLAVQHTDRDPHKHWSKMRKHYRLQWGSFDLELGAQTRVMGIVNVTPDSFSDGGRFFSTKAAIAHAEKMIEDGADIIDVGGESTRPFSDPVPASEELKRVIPIISHLAPRSPVPISIDTTKSEVAHRAFEAGAAMLNDIGALRLDARLAEVAAKHDVPVVLMHMLGVPKNMQIQPQYQDLTADISTFLESAFQRAQKSGIAKERLIADPGIGFGKTFDHNLQILKSLNAFEHLEVPIMVGPSRKAFVRNLLKDKACKDIDPQLPVVETGTQAAVSAAVLSGAHIVRVHDVANTKATLKIIDAICQA
jgi:dihydropteroate synthase